MFQIQVTTKCEVLQDKNYGYKSNCNDLIIDWKKAEANNFPDVNVRYTLKLCNMNDNGNSIKLTSAPKQTKVEFFYPIGAGIVHNKTKKYIVNKNFNDVVLMPGKCEEVTGTARLPVKRAKYFMMAILQGEQRTQLDETVPDGFCYAYSYNKIDFKYDYGLGDCKVDVST